MTANPVIEKLRKLLARASTDSGATQAEAETAMAKAAELARQHNLDLAAVQLTKGEDIAKGIETDRTDNAPKKATKRRPHHNDIAGVLQRCFGIHFIWFGSTSRFAIVGEKTDVAIATYCFHFLDELFPRAYTNWFKTLGVPFTGQYGVYRKRPSFYRGLATGIIEANKREEAKMERSLKDRYALVLVKKDEIVKHRVAAEFPDLKDIKVRAKSEDAEAYYRGREKGRDVKLNGGLTNGNNSDKLN